MDASKKRWQERKRSAMPWAGPTSSLLKAVKMPWSGLKHLFEDMDTRSTVSARSEKGRKLEAAMLRAKEIQAQLNKEKEEKSQKEKRKKKEVAPKEEVREEE